MKSQKPTPGNKQLLVKYAGLTTQILAMLAITVFIGLKIDKWLSFSIPLFIWLLPLLSLIGIIYHVLKDTSNKT
jgi:hypothetical protein